MSLSVLAEWPRKEERSIVSIYGISNILFLGKKKYMETNIITEDLPSECKF